MKSPLLLIVPSLAAQLTAVLKLPVPCTVALHCAVAFALTVAGVQLTTTEVMEDAAAPTVTEAVPDLVASCVLVAVTVTVLAVAGAVNKPPNVIFPPLADHVTAEL